MNRDALTAQVTDLEGKLAAAVLVVEQGVKAKEGTDADLLALQSKCKAREEEMARMYEKIKEQNVAAEEVLSPFFHFFHVLLLKSKIMLSM
jgi:hypothetical protein